MQTHNHVADEPKANIVAHRYNETDLLEIEYEGRPVFLAQQVGMMLGYADPGKLAKNLGEKWATDLVEGQDLIKLTNGKLASFKRSLNWVPVQDPVSAGSDVAAVDQSPGRDLVDPRTPNLILLTESGAQLVAMLARTHQGRAFRRWLVDVVLPSWRQRHQPTAPPAPPAAPAPAPRGRRPRALPAPSAEAQLALAPAPRPAVAAVIGDTPEERMARANRYGQEQPLGLCTLRELVIGQCIAVVRMLDKRGPAVVALEALAGAQAPLVADSADAEVVALTQAIHLLRGLPDAKVTAARSAVGELVFDRGPKETLVLGLVMGLLRQELHGLPTPALYDVLAYASKLAAANGRPTHAA